MGLLHSRTNERSRSRRTPAPPVSQSCGMPASAGCARTSRRGMSCASGVVTMV
jgi:hypothetical protein